MDYDREFLTGTVGVLILSLLAEREMYGYEIVQEAERRSAQALLLKEGTVYPALHQMERDGLLVLWGYIVGVLSWVYIGFWWGAFAALIHRIVHLFV